MRIYKCVHCGKAHTIAMKLIARNESLNIIVWCPSCDKRATENSFVSYKNFTKKEIEEMEVYADYRQSDEKCSHEECNNPAQENHHSAPKYIFGETEANKWPRYWLCKQHHDLWHKMVTPDMCKK